MSITIQNLVVAKKEMTNEQRLATMLATGIEPDLDALWTFFIHEAYAVFVSAYTGNLNCNCRDLADTYISGLKLKRPVEECLAEAKQRIADYESGKYDE